MARRSRASASARASSARTLMNEFSSGSISAMHRRLSSTAARALSSPVRIRSASTAMLMAEYRPAGGVPGGKRRFDLGQMDEHGGEECLYRFKVGVARRLRPDEERERGASRPRYRLILHADLRVPVLQVPGALRGVPGDVDQSRATVSELRVARQWSGSCPGSTPSGFRATSPGIASAAAGTELAYFHVALLQVERFHRDLKSF